MKTLIIGANDSGQRLDRFLKKAFPALPNAMLYRAIRTKHIKHNGRRAAMDSLLQEGDSISLFLPEDTLILPQIQTDFLQASRELCVAYEDAQLLVLDKPPGLLAHPDGKTYTDTLIARVLRYLYEKGSFDPHSESSFTPALVNRIDRNTGGLVLAAKTAQSLRILNEKMRAGEIEKRYLCAATGTPKWEETLLEGYLRKDTVSNTVQIFNEPSEGCKEIRTRYRVLAQNGALCLLEAQLFTGRSHQIRAQLAREGLPLLGDAKYGNAENNRRYAQHTQCLYSYQIRFDFREEDSPLAYLRGKTVTAQGVWFKKLFS